jgi:hypothetical protein
VSIGSSSNSGGVLPLSPPAPGELGGVAEMAKTAATPDMGRSTTVWAEEAVFLHPHTGPTRDFFYFPFRREKKNR